MSIRISQSHEDQARILETVPSLDPGVAKHANAAHIESGREFLTCAFISRSAFGEID
jgi:hypothetical protein